MSLSATNILAGPCRRWYSLSQANRSLVLIRRIVQDIVREHARVVELQELVELTDTRSSARARAGTDLRETIQRLGAHLQELDELGVLLIDYAAGAVEFPCQEAGREVFLSWQAGQERISAWHEVDGEHQPIETLTELCANA